MTRKLKSQLESLLFIAAKPLSLKEIAKSLDKPLADIESGLEALAEDCRKEERGVRVIRQDSRFQMVSSPQNSSVVQSFIKEESSGELTRPSLEALTIIAYRGPISKLDLDRIRGVNCSLILRNLLLRGLVKVNKDAKKEENYYTVTMDFLRFLGVNDIKELPDYDKLSQDDTIDRILSEKEK